MSSRKFAFATAAALAAVALSACSGTGGAEPKPWPNVGTGGAVAAPTSATVRPAGSPANTAVSNWIGLAGQPVPDKERDTSEWHLRFGAPTAVGVGVWERATEAGCTLGPVVAPTMSLTSRGYVTAGHCDSPATVPVVTYTDAGRTDARSVGVYTPEPATGRTVDVTSLWISESSPAPAIAGRKVAGVFTDAAVRDPKLEGQPVCVLAAASGLACGDLVTVTGTEIAVDIPTRKGDSGAPIFLVDGDTGAVTLIGVLTDNSAGRTSYGTAADTALRSLGAKLVTDPGVAVDPGVDVRYSDQAVTAD